MKFILHNDELYTVEFCTT